MKLCNKLKKPISKKKLDYTMADGIRISKETFFFFKLKQVLGKEKKKKNSFIMKPVLGCTSFLSIRNIKIGNGVSGRKKTLVYLN